MQCIRRRVLTYTQTTHTQDCEEVQLLLRRYTDLKALLFALLCVDGSLHSVHCQEEEEEEFIRQVLQQGQ